VSAAEAMQRRCRLRRAERRDRARPAALDVQFTRAKGFDTFCPVGPRGHSDWRALEVICRVNGVVRQHGRAAGHAVRHSRAARVHQRIMTLEPGDVIATGTPEGVGPLFAGDVVEVEIPGVSRVSNPVDRSSA
jgi:2-keto-4-pentenoate hydratase/2-oxohepta-3-ene-1,7-dioic acid hydratase in catechol pathway